MRQNRQENWPQTWEEIFAGIPTAPGSQAEQQRHRQQREQGEMTEAEEGELNVLFYVIYPQLAPEARHMNTRDTCQCHSGDGICGYHANKTRRFKQRLSYISRTSRPHANRMYQVSSVDEPLTLSSVFGGLAGCFGIPLGGMVWLAWFSSASFAVSMAYWTIVAFVTLVASIILWLKWS